MSLYAGSEREGSSPLISNVGQDDNGFKGEKVDTTFDPYQAFLRRKVVSIPALGFEIDRSEVNPLLKPHQIDSVIWAVRGGRRAFSTQWTKGTICRNWPRWQDDHPP